MNHTARYIYTLQLLSANDLLLILFNFPIPRMCTADIEGVVLPKGTNLIINIYGLHRKESVWGENATKFDPQHFHPDEVSKRHPYSLLSFANGTRMCIGW